MFADPQSAIVTGSTATTLPRTGAGLTSGTFTSADGTVKLTVDHVLGRRNRRTVRFDMSKITSDPLIPSQNSRVSFSAYTVLNAPQNGATAAEQVKLLTALAAWMTEANITKLVGGEI